MFDNRVTLRVLFAVICCFALVMVPLLVSAQGIIRETEHGIQKGAEGVQKGVEGAVEKGKQGAEAVGKGTKKAITGEENKPSDNRMKPQENPTETQRGENLPKTAGELPLLALAGCLALAAAAASKAFRRQGS